MIPKGSLPVPSQKAQVITFASIASPFSHMLDSRLCRRNLCYQRQSTVMLWAKPDQVLYGKIQQIALLYLVVVHQLTNYSGCLDAG